MTTDGCRFLDYRFGRIIEYIVLSVVVHYGGSRKAGSAHGSSSASGHLTQYR